MSEVKAHEMVLQLKDVHHRAFHLIKMEPPGHATYLRGFENFPVVAATNFVVMIGSTFGNRSFDPH